ncbi:MAG: class I SAM-dependent methyltransferase [Bacteroidota bacterium]
MKLNRTILEPEVQEFINSNWNADLTRILLKKQIFDEIPQKVLVEQLEAKKKCVQKLPTWFRTPKVYYPNKMNIEQSSSEITASYKADLVKGALLLDLSGGFGVDSYYFANRFTKVIHCEKDASLSRITAYNFKLFQKENINCFPQDGIAFLQRQEHPLDWIFVDPSRRDASKKRIFKLKDGLPNVLLHLELFFKKSSNVMLKTAPLLDISEGIQQLPYVKEIHVISVKDEVKELLWILQKGVLDEPIVKTVNISGDVIQRFQFLLSEEQAASSRYSAPLNYLYLPNTAILKSGAFKKIGEDYNLYKLHKHSHLYTSSTLIGFPGKRFKIDKVLPYHKKTIQKEGIVKANIAVRNFPKSVATLRQETKVKPGGEDYLFFTTDTNTNLIVVFCTRVIEDRAI